VGLKTQKIDFGRPLRSNNQKVTMRRGWLKPKEIQFQHVSDLSKAGVAVPVADRSRFWVRQQKSLCRRNCSVSTTLKAGYDLNCAESAVKLQPASQS